MKQVTQLARELHDYMRFRAEKEGLKARPDTGSLR
jgi:hypothetical protein